MLLKLKLNKIWYKEYTKNSGKRQIYVYRLVILFFLCQMMPRLIAGVLIGMAPWSVYTDKDEWPGKSAEGNPASSSSLRNEIPKTISVLKQK